MEIEALRQIGDMLKLINGQFLEHQKLLLDVRDRVIAIESNRLEGEVAALNDRVNRLGDRMTAVEHAEIRRGAQVGVVGWISEKLPWLIGIVVAALAIVGVDKIADK